MILAASTSNFKQLSYLWKGGKAVSSARAGKQLQVLLHPSAGNRPPEGHARQSSLCSKECLFNGEHEEAYKPASHFFLG